MLYSIIDKSSGSGAHCESEKNINFPISGPNVRNGECVDIHTDGDKIFNVKLKNQRPIHGFQMQGTKRLDMQGINRFKGTKGQGQLVPEILCTW
jgi:hypothetical protein